MISVIVPVYNVEPFLTKCLDSIIDQTYNNLEIILIDDGSTDHSGEICDKYAERDSRIRVYHTGNKGLSAARNLGLDHARGDYIGFVDSDDWIELDMYDCLYRAAKRTEADVVECGVFRESQNSTVEIKRTDVQMSGMDAIRALMRQEITNGVWDKLWKYQCFDSIRFTEGRIFEDVAVTYRLFLNATSVCTIAESKYHYLQRKDSLSMKNDMNSLTGYWLSVSERYDYLHNQVDEGIKKDLLRTCARATAKTWANYNDCTRKERKDFQDIIREMNCFTKRNIPLFGYRGWKYEIRLGVFFPHFLCAFSFRMAWLLNRARINYITKKINNKMIKK